MSLRARKCALCRMMFDAAADDPVTVCDYCTEHHYSRSGTGLVRHRELAAMSDDGAEVGVLESLVVALVAAEAVDMEHRQFIYRSGPEDWDAVPMSDAQHATLHRVYSDAVLTKC